MTQMKGLSVPSTNLQMTPKRAFVNTPEEQDPKGSGHSGELGPWESHGCIRPSEM